MIGASPGEDEIRIDRFIKAILGVIRIPDTKLGQGSILRVRIPVLYLGELFNCLGVVIIRKGL